MATNSSLQKQMNQASQRAKAPSASSLIKQTLGRDDIQRRFHEVLRDKAPQFMSSIVNVVNSNKKLQEVNAMSVISSAMVAATMDLPIDQNLGYMWIVPYKGQATPQMGYKGYIQLALRTGQYEAINAAEVYEGELESWNRLTEEIKLNPNGRTSDTVIGYFGYFKLINGFKKRFIGLSTRSMHTDVNLARCQAELNHLVFGLITLMLWPKRRFCATCCLSGAFYLSKCKTPSLKMRCHRYWTRTQIR